MYRKRDKFYIALLTICGSFVLGTMAGIPYDQFTNSTLAQSDFYKDSITWGYIIGAVVVLVVCAIACVRNCSNKSYLLWLIRVQVVLWLLWSIGIPCIPCIPCISCCHQAGISLNWPPYLLGSVIYAIFAPVAATSFAISVVSSFKNECLDTK